MKNKFTGLIFLMWVFALPGYAQWSVGIEGGYNQNALYTNVGALSFTKYVPQNGFSVGIPVQYKVKDWFSIQADPQFIQKNYELKRTQFFEGIYQKNINSYVQLPLMGRFTFGGEKLKGFLNLGGYASYWSMGRIKGVQANIFSDIESSSDTQEYDRYLELKNGYSYNEPYTFDERKDNRLELGWLTGVGVSYQYKKYQFFVEGRYYQSITDQQKNYMINQIPRYNQTYTAQIGCLYQFAKKPKKSTSSN
ncbi:porin family protein [Siphonobacter sp. SORGH_AS_1065]|uniref:porin family protein n=1 Tax=Siphonobacter sp. SORGH_AS_1065 TaxID=3041795 RepID=UPI00278A2228|nr:porin family protein [Siphonobacter sp. SORGH_AS_1065]MDQ1089675.1 hypothetical protein [Siphonobacter sp. SORGH_AS_1065]